MSLLDIKKHLMEIKISSLANLSSYFKVDADLLRQMLGHWVKKGKVRCFSRQMMCEGKCTQCGSCATEIYEWLAA